MNPTKNEIARLAGFIVDEKEEKKIEDKSRGEVYGYGRQPKDYGTFYESMCWTGD